jgi:hypothetical protein
MAVIITELRASDNCSTDVLNLLLNTVMRAKIELQRTTKQLEQNLKADFRDRWVVSAFRKLISNERI